MAVERDHVIAPLAAAIIQLYSRLWLELEALCNLMLGEAAKSGKAPSGVEARLEIIRLEVVLLLDGCRSARWRSLLRPEQLAALRADLDAVLDSLDSPAGVPGFDGIFSAQNRLFDAVVDRYAQRPTASISPFPRLSSISPASLQTAGHPQGWASSAARWSKKCAS